MPTPKKTGILAGVGIASVVAALAGAYYFYGSKEGKSHRTKLKAWSVKMKGDVMERLEDLKEVNQELYEKTVDTVAEQYEKVKNVTPADVAKVAKELKSYWKHMQRELASDTKKTATKAKKIVKAVKKATT